MRTTCVQKLTAVVTKPLKVNSISRLICLLVVVVLSFVEGFDFRLQPQIARNSHQASVSALQLRFKVRLQECVATVGICMLAAKCKRGPLVQESRGL